MTIQSVKFPKDKFTVSEAKEWLKEHKFKYGKVDNRGKFYKFKQVNPNEFDNYTTNVLPNGIELIIAFKEGGDIDLHSLLPKIPLNPPGFKYLGPNNPLSEQVDLETGIPRPGHEPTNDLDRISLKHDLLYNRAEEEGINKKDILQRKHYADAIFIKEAELTPGKSWWEKAWNWISRKIIGGKMKLGLGITADHVIDNLKNAKTKDKIMQYLNTKVYVY